MLKLFTASTVTLLALSGMVFGLVLAILQITESLNLPLALGLTLLFNVLGWWFSPILMEWMLRLTNKTTILSPEEVQAAYPHLHTLITGICAEHHIPFPRVGIINDQNPTAFTFGSLPSNARVVLSEGIATYLTPQQQAAVVAHEMGHIVHRDFVVMAVAATLVQMLYQIYVSLSKVKTSGKKGNQLAMLGLAAYVGYLIGTYALLYLSRTREYMADRFAAAKTSPADLANALLRIAYGIMVVDDTEETHHLLHSARTLNIMDYKTAEQIGTTYKLSDGKQTVLAQSMLFDTVNPWASLAELSSTHPLVGKRIKALIRFGEETGRPFAVFDEEAALRSANVTRRQIRNHFTGELLTYLAPWAILLAGMAVLPLFMAFILFLLACMGLVGWKYPSSGAPKETTVLTLMTNPLASPVRGQSAALSGTVIGRGEAGSVFSPNLMFQDATGLLYVRFISMLGGLGALLKGLFGTSRTIGEPATVSGWFFRSSSSWLTLRQLNTTNGKGTWAAPNMAEYLQLGFFLLLAIAGFITAPEVYLLPLLPLFN